MAKAEPVASKRSFSEIALVFTYLAPGWGVPDESAANRPELAGVTLAAVERRALESLIWLALQQ